MVEKKQRPGVMLYFDSIRPALNRLQNEQLGALFRAVLDYSEYGEVPDLEPMTGMVFDLLRPKLDRDAERYEEGREQRQFATYCREAKKKGLEQLTFEQWKVVNSLSCVGSPSPSPFYPSTAPVPVGGGDVDADADVDVDADADGDVVGYQPSTGNIGPISPDNESSTKGVYHPLSEQDFEQQREAAIEKLRNARGSAKVKTG